ncbi:MAG: ABC transporter permease, partial [Helicobacter sp.]|nr:ABC transporter permease [Helicobacter sp.]
MIHIISALFLRELKTRFGKNRKLGYFWVIGEPMLNILFFLIIVTLIRAQSIPQVPFTMFLVTGIVPFFMFKNIITQIIAGVSANTALLAYKPVKPIHIFIARAFLEVCIYSFVFVLFMIAFGWFLDLTIIPANFLEVVIAFIGLALLGFSLGVCLAFLSSELEYSQIFINYGLNI